MLFVVKPYQVVTEDPSGTAHGTPYAYDANVPKRPALWQQPKFWIATSIIVAVVAGVTIYAVYEPDVESNLRF